MDHFYESKKFANRFEYRPQKRIGHEYRKDCFFVFWTNLDPLFGTHFSSYCISFLLISTLAHEMGHGVGALLIGGHFNSFFMFPDGSGMANISGDFSRFGKAFVAFLGLIGPALLASFLFISMKTLRRARASLCLLALIQSLSLVFVVRNVFGIFFVALLTAICFFFSLGKAKNYAQTVVAFLAAQLSLSVFSRIDYLFTKTAITSQGPMPSDVAQIADALFLPYWFFGALCALISIIVLFSGLKSLFK